MGLDLSPHRVVRLGLVVKATIVGVPFPTDAKWSSAITTFTDPTSHLETVLFTGFRLSRRSVGGRRFGERGLFEM